MKNVVMAIVVLSALLVVLGPLLAIWSLNALFGVGIAYTMKTWFAAPVLSAIVSGSCNASRSK